MNVKTRILVVGIILLLCGCATSKDLRPIAIIREGTLPVRAYHETGMVSREDFAGEEEHSIEEMVKSARKKGADGIILLQGRSTGYNWNPFGRSGDRYLWRAATFVYEPIKSP